MLDVGVAGNQNLGIKELNSKSTEEAPLWMLLKPRPVLSVTIILQWKEVSHWPRLSL